MVLRFTLFDAWTLVVVLITAVAHAHEGGTGLEALYFDGQNMSHDGSTITNGPFGQRFAHIQNLISQDILATGRKNLDPSIFPATYNLGSQNVPYYDGNKIILLDDTDIYFGSAGIGPEVHNRQFGAMVMGHVSVNCTDNYSIRVGSIGPVQVFMEEKDAQGNFLQFRRVFYDWGQHSFRERQGATAYPLQANTPYRFMVWTVRKGGTENQIRVTFGSNCRAAATIKQVHMYPSTEQYSCNVPGGIQTPQSPVDFSEPSVQRAIRIFRRITGRSINPFQDDRIERMAALIDASNPEAAVQIAMEDPGFMSTVRHMAAEMASTEYDPRTEFNDFIATVMVAVRDRWKLPRLLDRNIFARGQTSAFYGDQSFQSEEAIFGSNEHYDFLAARFRNDWGKLACVLETIDASQVDADLHNNRYRQKVYHQNNQNWATHPDPGGLMTTRFWASKNYGGGTGRRPFFSAVKTFGCMERDQVRDQDVPTGFIGQDVTRFPAGNHEDFKQICSSCHGMMDGARGAFAYFNFDHGLVKYSPYWPATPAGQTEGPGDVKKDPATHVIDGLLKNNNVSPLGYQYADDGWINYANRNSNAQKFGWGPGSDSGNGVGDFARAFSQTQVISQCMVKRVFKTVCKRELLESEQSLLNQLSVDFSGNLNMVLRDLFVRVASIDGCIGE